MNELQVPLQIILEDSAMAADATRLTQALEGVKASAPFALVLTEGRLELRKLDEPKLGGVYVDLADGAAAHRRKFGGGRGQSIAKAIGLKKGHTPSVLDGTAGLGRDAFVLAALGCKVALCERHPVVHALLADGLRRAALDGDIGDWISERMQLLPFGYTLAKAAEVITAPEVVYLDPMFPHKKKSALVKKEMRVFQSLVGPDLDADALLPQALQLARARVVVKRPSYAGFLNEVSPSAQITTKGNRFDLYVKQALGR
ncbi:class I SAM-dependent methyltransferase [Oceanisphaera pacifica]|uniref:Ribosomal RNA small subunit methyltransferase J n=1 Tax=Oceanisphaera pacifica TaxID=2818389 RepID=A0ABS3NH58_9GAMM|nr:class I SAM-dependent methyltransferase [Oceanisphaera pacifica]MBO1519929.1 class I SAM-dependent methyltransferase [Oceanisphaera pacifica]